MIRGGGVRPWGLMLMPEDWNQQDGDAGAKVTPLLWTCLMPHMETGGNRLGHGAGGIRFAIH